MESGIAMWRHASVRHWCICWHFLLPNNSNLALVKGVFIHFGTYSTNLQSWDFCDFVWDFRKQSVETLAVFDWVLSHRLCVLFARPMKTLLMPSVNSSTWRMWTVHTALATTSSGFQYTMPRHNSVYWLLVFFTVSTAKSCPNLYLYALFGVFFVVP